jgi:hypothetical protein
MTDKSKLLPLPEMPESRYSDGGAHTSRQMREYATDYATRCVAHALAPVVAERDGAQLRWHLACDDMSKMQARAEAAESERDALRAFVKEIEGGTWFMDDAAKRARTLLAALATATKERT